jgi:hypothetical protein
MRCSPLKSTHVHLRVHEGGYARTNIKSVSTCERI